MKRNEFAFLRAREVLLRHRDDYPAAYRAFGWPLLDRFNWALEFWEDDVS